MQRVNKVKYGTRFPTDTDPSATADTDAITTTDSGGKAVGTSGNRAGRPCTCRTSGNPALEEGKDDASSDEYSDTSDADSNAEDGGDTDYDSLSDYLNEDDIPDYKLQENNRSKGEQAEEIPFSDATSFYETLKEQLGERNLTEHQRELAEYLIGSLDDDGLLRKSLESISDELAIYAGIEATTEELEEVLKSFRTSTPPDWEPAICRSVSSSRYGAR